jgi:hypothetical protein
MALSIYIYLSIELFWIELCFPSAYKEYPSWFNHLNDNITLKAKKCREADHYIIFRSLLLVKIPLK